MGLGRALLEGLHLLHTIADGNLQVTLGDIGGRADGVEHLLLHLSASALGLQGECLNGGVGLVAQLGDLSVELVVQEPAGVLVHLGTTLLNELGALLTLENSVMDGVVELILVGLLKGGNLFAALSRLGSVGLDDTSEVLDLLVGLGIVLANNDTELVDLVAEHGLGLADSVHGIEAHATGGSSHGSVLLGLHSLVLPESGPDTRGGLTETVLGVLAVLGELLADRGKGRVELHGHAVQAVVGRSLVLVDQLLELDIVVEVLLVTLVAKLDHAGHLSIHIGIHLGLGGTVGADNTGSVVNPGVHLGHLLLHSGRELEEADLELGLGSSDLLGSIGAGSGDVAHSLGIALGLESLLGVEGSLKAHGGLLECHINLVTVLSHLGLDIVELSSGGGNEGLDLVVGPSTGSLILRSELGRKTAAGGLRVTTEVLDLVVPRVHGILKVLASLLGVLLNLGSVGSDVLVHAVDASVGGRGPGRGSSLPALHSHAQVVGCLTAAVVGHRDGATIATEGGT